MSGDKETPACVCVLGTGLVGGAIAVALHKAGVILEDAVVTTSPSTPASDQQFSTVVVVSSADVDSKVLAEACKPLVADGKLFLVQPSTKVRSSSLQLAVRHRRCCCIKRRITCRLPASGLSSCVG